ncbi:MAG: AAA family ATPase, partial [Elusimicrobiota bacterium]|nr:AAA family ATPase [Elusimicrobiota bacterium]
MKKQLETKKKAQKIFDKSAALIPLAIQEFSQLRNEGCIYIDKTKSILKMLSLRRVYFLSRPRRFGKSLLISTLDSLFRGEKQLFKGLYIYDKWDWSETYNVIRLDFTLEAMSTPQELRDGLAQTLNDIAAANAITLNSSSLPKIFFELIKKLYELNGRQIVILVDEYDLPIL